MRIVSITRQKHCVLVIVAALLTVGTWGLRPAVRAPRAASGNDDESLASSGVISQGSFQLPDRRLLRVIPVRKTPPCTSYAYTKGRWQRAPCGISSNVGIGMNYTTRRHPSSTGMGCALVDPGGSTQTPESSCEASTCDWAVSGPCNLLSFETDSLCRSLAGRSILFVGDSITGTQFHSLAYLTIGASLVGSPWTPEHSWGTPIGICNNLSSIAFVRNDVLAPIAATEWKALTTSANAANLSYFSWDLPSGAEKLAVDIYHSFPWVDRLKDFHILVLNTGIHLRGRSDVAFQEGLAVAFSYLHNNYHGQVFYRLTTRGHPRCENATASPISGSYADYLAEHPDDHPEYEWDRVPAINSIERKLAAKFGVTLLDVVAMTEARPDSHVQGAKRDCLHYKLPSVVDSWNWLLYNAIAGRAI